MANEPYTRTNQKFYFAGLALEAMGKAAEGQTMNAQGLEQAEREAALFHLYGALLGVCHEIAGFYRLPHADTDRVERLLDPAVLAAHPVPELSELVELATQRETWLAQFLSAYHGLFQPPKPDRAPKGDVTQALIIAVAVESDEVPVLSRGELESWRRQLKEIVVRFREGLSEC